MTLRMSKSAIDRLGERLRSADEITAEDLRTLQGFIVQHSDPLASAVRIVQDQLGLKPAPRLKTRNTLVEKLRRPPHIQLSRIQDIAGMRVVASGTRVDQDRVVEQICGAFEDSKVKDRRKEPSYGYRAVHVVLKVDGLNVEVQVRTVWQDRWAQIVERLGDAWGRQIRYGRPPQEPDRLLSPGVSRAKVWAIVLKISDLIDTVEEFDREAANMEARLSRVLPDLEDLDEPKGQKLLSEAFEARDRLISTRDKPRVGLEEALDLLGNMLEELG